MQGAWVWSLARELRFYMLCSAAKKIKMLILKNQVSIYLSPLAESRRQTLDALIKRSSLRPLCKPSLCIFNNSSTRYTDPRVPKEAQISALPVWRREKLIWVWKTCRFFKGRR